MASRIGMAGVGLSLGWAGVGMVGRTGSVRPDTSSGSARLDPTRSVFGIGEARPDMIRL